MEPEKVVRGGFLLGLAVGIGAAVIGPALWRLARPAAKDAIKAGVAGYGAARVALARAGEEVEDLVAEAAHEMKEAAASAADAMDETEDAAGAIVRG
ncbi:DUF5132 domain-containing protein [Xanthobacter pseudotagetidis]|uniref:DUF5132 domain-containing protein n=1 Tax=Xanthobacter pseudotagetidis TaxID=3119911 RepID=UPI00372B92B7